ncbi:MAG TPA: hypothetical protein VGL21_17725, partial [Jatrophihabitantaceae bacterium]
MTDDPIPPRRRRRRAVWRAGVGISRTDDPATAVTPGVDDAAVPPRPAPPPERPGPAAAPAPSSVPSASPSASPGEAKPPIKRRRSDPTERGLRDLVGAGPS